MHVVRAYLQAVCQLLGGHEAQEVGGAVPDGKRRGDAMIYNHQ